MEKEKKTYASKIFIDVFSSQLLTVVGSNIAVAIMIFYEIYALAFINLVIAGYIVSLQSGTISSNKFIAEHLEEGLVKFNELTGGKVKTNLLNNTSKRIAIEEALSNACNGSGEVFIVTLLIILVDAITLVFKWSGAF
jgi:hypothetical protein|nr:MAG TPA: hypothetical protein [Caudoviricetes sp.]